MAKKLTPEAQRETVYVYIGPSVRGLLQSGTIMRGTKDDAMRQLGRAVDIYGDVISTLVVEDVELAEARNKIRAGGNLLANAYAAMLNKKEE